MSNFKSTGKVFRGPIYGTIWCFESKADFEEFSTKAGDGIRFETEKETYRIFHAGDGTKYYRRCVGCPKIMKILVDKEPMRVFKPRYLDANIIDRKNSKYSVVRGISEEKVLKEALKHYYDEVHMQYDRGKDPEYDGRNLARLKVLRRLKKRLKEASWFY